MAFLILFFTVALSLCVVGLIVIALAAILGSVRDDWKFKKPKREIRPGDYWFDNYCRPQSSSASRVTAGAFGFWLSPNSASAPWRLRDSIRQFPNIYMESTQISDE
jgi:hypothetical protein